MEPYYEIRPSKGLKRLKGKAHVALIGDNGKVLSTSETLNSEDAIQGNIRAQRRAGQTLRVRDKRVVGP